MNKEVRELRKAGEIAGIEVSWFGEVISSKTHKFYKSLASIKGCNLNIFKKVLHLRSISLNSFGYCFLNFDSSSKSIPFDLKTLS